MTAGVFAANFRVWFSLVVLAVILLRFNFYEFWMIF
jgi:hypothetical protein